MMVHLLWLLLGLGIGMLSACPPQQVLSAGACTTKFVAEKRNEFDTQRAFPHRHLPAELETKLTNHMAALKDVMKGKAKQPPTNVNFPVLLKSMYEAVGIQGTIATLGQASGHLCHPLFHMLGDVLWPLIPWDAALDVLGTDCAAALLHSFVEQEIANLSSLEESSTESVKRVADWVNVTTERFRMDFSSPTPKYPSHVLYPQVTNMLHGAAHGMLRYLHYVKHVDMHSRAAQAGACMSLYHPYERHGCFIGIHDIWSRPFPQFFNDPDPPTIQRAAEICRSLSHSVGSCYFTRIMLQHTAQRLNISSAQWEQFCDSIQPEEEKLGCVLALGAFLYPCQKHSPEAFCISTSLKRCVGRVTQSEQVACIYGSIHAWYRFKGTPAQFPYCRFLPATLQPICEEAAIFVKSFVPDDELYLLFEAVRLGISPEASWERNSWMLRLSGVR